MSPETHDPVLASLAKSLAELAPSAGRLDRDQVLFRAGQASAGHQSRFWRSIAGVMTLLAVAVGSAPFLRPVPQRVQCIIYQRIAMPASWADLLVAEPSSPRNAAPSTAEEVVPQAELLSYSRLQRVVLASGVDAWPNLPATLGARQRDPLLDGPTDVLSWNHWLRIQTP